MIKLFIGMHVLFGSVAMLGMVGAFAFKKGGLWHRRSGKMYVSGMAASLSIAFVVSALTNNVFLFLIGLFSGYFVFTGYRTAKARDGGRTALDKRITYLTALVGVGMLMYGVVAFRDSVSAANIMIVFGSITIGIAVTDIKLGDSWPIGVDRIVLHLNRMGGASIASVTAVFVANVDTNPEFIAWLLPTVVGTPIIGFWTRKTIGGRVQKQPV